MDKSFMIIDTSWITTILGISFSLVIFLLGFPIFFWQTYVPESLREYHSKIQNHQEGLIKKSIILLIPIILLFSIHIFQFTITEYVNFCTSWKEKITLIFVVVTLGYFIFFIFIILNYFKKSVIKEEDAKTVILDSIFEEIKTKKIIKEEFIKEIIEREEIKKYTIAIGKKNIGCQGILIEFAAIYHSPYDRNSFLKKIFELIEHKIKNEYSGSDIEPIYNPILSNIFVKDLHHCSIANVNEVINVTKEIASKYDNNSSNSKDQQFITREFLLDLCFILIEKYDFNVAQKCISCLKEFNCSQDVLFKIFYFAFTKREYLYLTIEIGHLSKKLISNSFGNKESLSSIKYNLIAYLSMFYNENDMTKMYALQKLEDLKEWEKELTKLDFEEARTHFYDEYKFDTAHNIHLMIQGYFENLPKGDF